jgi:hypothetical protein
MDNQQLNAAFGVWTQQNGWIQQSTGAPIGNNMPPYCLVLEIQRLLLLLLLTTALPPPLGLYRRLLWACGLYHLSPLVLL